MKTIHQLFFSDSRSMSQIDDESVDLILTSPPYPMIEMWDSLYKALNPKIKSALSKENGDQAFELMHREMDKVWKESFRVLKEGGIACINIGDAVRTVGKQFQLYSNHSRITQAFKKIGFHTLPLILWHKKTNAPNKFMGSGMLPAGAYMTLEHEYILLFRKGGKREFKTAQAKICRQKSSFFYEERNKWFSDIWLDIAGAPQNTNHKNLRHRNAAFPFELAYRLICMYSVQGDRVLDPFMGTGTTALAAIGAGRNSLGVEIDPSFREYIINRSINSVQDLNYRISQRLWNHIQWAEKYTLQKQVMKYKNSNYGFPVMTRQETLLQFPYIKSIKLIDKHSLSAKYSTAKHSTNLKIKDSQTESELKNLNLSFI